MADMMPTTGTTHWNDDDEDSESQCSSSSSSSWEDIIPEVPSVEDRHDRCAVAFISMEGDGESMQLTESTTISGPSKTSTEEETDDASCKESESLDTTICTLTSLDDISSAATRSPRKDISAKILEKTEWLTQLFIRAEPKQPPQSTTEPGMKPRRKSKLVADRLAWLQAQFLDETTNGEIKSDLSDVSPRRRRDSDLVADRKRWLEEMRESLDNNVSSVPNLPGLNPTVLQGLASDRSKWLEGLAEEHVKAGKSWEQLEARKKRSSGKLLQSNRLPTSPESPSSSHNAVAHAGPFVTPTVFGSVAEKRALFLVESRKVKTPTPTRTKQPKEVANNNMQVQMVNKTKSFLEHVMNEWEKEGLLPGFLADHTTWLFGGFCGGGCQQEDRILRLADQLRLEAHDECDGKFDDESRLISLVEPQTPDTHGVHAAAAKTNEPSNDTGDSPSHGSSPEKLHYGPATLEETEWQDMPWSQMTFQECIVVTKEAGPCSLC